MLLGIHHKTIFFWKIIIYAKKSHMKKVSLYFCKSIFKINFTWHMHKWPIKVIVTSLLKFEIHFFELSRLLSTPWPAQFWIYFTPLTLNSQNLQKKLWHKLPPVKKRVCVWVCITIVSISIMQSINFSRFCEHERDI